MIATIPNGIRAAAAMLLPLLMLATPAYPVEQRHPAGAAGEAFLADAAATARADLDAVELEALSGAICERTWLPLLEAARSSRNEALDQEGAFLAEWEAAVRDDRRAIASDLRNRGGQRRRIMEELRRARAEEADLTNRRQALVEALGAEGTEPGSQLRALDDIIESKKTQIAALQGGADNFETASSNDQLALNGLRDSIVLVVEFQNEVEALRISWTQFFAARESQLRLQHARECSVPRFRRPSRTDMPRILDPARQ